MVSELTAERPRSYILCELMAESTTVKPSDSRSAVQKGAESQMASTRGMPMRMPLSGRICLWSRLANSNRVRSSNRLGTFEMAAAACLARSRTAWSWGSPMTSPREQRFPVT